MARSKWPYIVGSIALIGVGWLVTRKVIRMRNHTNDLEHVETVQ